MTVLIFDAWRAAEGSAQITGPGIAEVVDGVTSANDGDLLLVSGGSTTRAVRIAVGSMRRPGVAHVELAGPPSHRYLLGYALRHLPPGGVWH